MLNFFSLTFFGGNVRSDVQYRYTEKLYSAYFNPIIKTSCF